MATIGKLSPNVLLNSSMSPNLNMSDKLKFLMPPKSTSKDWSPIDLLNTDMKSPNLSPIAKVNSPSDFLKRRDYPKDRMEDNKKKRHTCFNEVFTVKDSNPNLETKLSVHTILKDLKLGHLNQIFEREEINLTAFFTLNNDDLQAIGIENDEARKKLLNFITFCGTPKNFKKIPAKNILIRH